MFCTRRAIHPGRSGSQTDGDSQTAQVPLVASVASGACTLTLSYHDLLGSKVLAQTPYAFPSPNATFQDVGASGQTQTTVSISANVVVSEPICPSDGACSWFGLVTVEPASSGRRYGRLDARLGRCGVELTRI